MRIPSKLKTLLVVGALFSSFMSLVTGAEPLAVGVAAPALKGVDQNNKPVDLGALYKNGYVLVYFYPKAGTPGCTTEACALRDAYADLTKEKLTVVGVSHDTVAEQKTFADKQKLPFTLVADPKGDMYTAFGVPSLVNRQSFLVKDGKIIWRDLAVNPTTSADDVRKAVAADKAKADAKPAPAASSTPAATTSKP